jgi:hypothetical protein
MCARGRTERRSWARALPAAAAPKVLARNQPPPCRPRARGGRCVEVDDGRRLAGLSRLSLTLRAQPRGSAAAAAPAPAYSRRSSPVRNRSSTSKPSGTERAGANFDVMAEDKKWRVGIFLGFHNNRLTHPARGTRIPAPPPSAAAAPSCCRRARAYSRRAAFALTRAEGHTPQSPPSSLRVDLLLLLRPACLRRSRWAVRRGSLGPRSRRPACRRRGSPRAPRRLPL